MPDPVHDTEPVAVSRDGEAHNADVSASSVRVVKLRRADPSADDAALAATDDDPELEAAVASHRLGRWRLAMPASGTWSPPVTGALAVIFGTAALFKLPLFLAPLAILLALIAGWRGHHGWAVIGLGTALVGLLTSAWFWTLLGLAWLYQSWG